jgi:hypothetical protein
MLFLLLDNMRLSVQHGRESEGAKNDPFCIFDLVDIFPGRMLLINVSCPPKSCASFARSILGFPPLGCNLG